jgi:uncharacterized protein YbjT (DUF2867 family)
MILISGATGTVGQALAKHLNETGVSYRALVRNPAKAQSWAGSNVELVQGDFDDPESLKAALAGVEKAFMLPPFVPNAEELQANFIEAAKAVGVQHVVKLSVVGADVDSPVSLIRLHGEGEQLLTGSGLAWTNVRANGFDQNMFQNAGTIKENGQFYQPAGDAKVSFVDVRDIAAVAAEALVGSGHEGKSYEVTGPEAIDFYKVAADLSAAIGKPVEYVPISDEQFKQTMAGFGAPEWMIQSLDELYAAYRSGYGSEVSGDVAKVIGRPAIPFAQFARDFASAFKA